MKRLHCLPVKSIAFIYTHRGLCHYGYSNSASSAAFSVCALCYPRLPFALLSLNPWLPPHTRLLPCACVFVYLLVAALQVVRRLVAVVMFLQEEIIRVFGPEGESDPRGEAM